MHLKADSYNRELLIKLRYSDMFLTCPLSPNPFSIPTETSRPNHQKDQLNCSVPPSPAELPSSFPSSLHPTTVPSFRAPTPIKLPKREQPIRSENSQGHGQRLLRPRRARSLRAEEREGREKGDFDTVGLAVAHAEAADGVLKGEGN